MGRIERKTAILAKELQRYNIDIAALSETRLSGEDQLVEKDSGYTIFWSGRSEKEKRQSGVGFAVKNSLVGRIEQPVGVSDRIIKLRLPLVAGRYLSIVSVYAPTLTSSEENVTAFYQALRSTLASIPCAESLIVLGDFNARVGSDSHTWSPIGPFGTGKLNSNGLMLLQLCTELNLVISNTFFHQKNNATWFHPQSKHGHVLDHIICRRSDLRNVCKVKVMRGADCDTDHLMVRAKLKVFVRRKNRCNSVKVPRRIDVGKLKSEHTRADLVSAFNQVDFTNCNWDSLKDVLYQKGSEVLGLRRVKHRDWFEENSEEINSLIEEKRKAHLRLLNATADGRPTAASQHSAIKANVQKRIRQIKNKWWSDLSKDIQLAHNQKDTKRFYSLLRQAYGPKSSSLTPLLSKDGETLHKSPDEILDRWYEHFRDLFHNPSVVDTAAIDTLPQQPLHSELDDEPTLEEVVKCIMSVNTNKAPGLDGVPVELLRHGGPNVHLAVHSIILSVWRGIQVPQDWVDAILIMLYKGKGKKSVCGSYRGISLLEAVGKVFARLLLNRLESSICKDAIPEAQSGFRGGRGTIDMIFSARQLVEKCIEQNRSLCQVFVDLTKAFDTVNRDALWTVLGKFGCTNSFVNKFRQLHANMKGRVNFNGQLTKELPIDNGVKQGDIPAPTLFSLYLAAMLWYAFNDCDIGVEIHFRTSGKVFNLKRLQSKTMVSSALFRELLYADDADLVTHSPEEMQIVMDRFSDACTKFGLTISIEKTKVMFTPASGQMYVEPDIFVYGNRLDVVKEFVYLGSKQSNDGQLDAEIKERISRAAGSFGGLEERVWSDRDIYLSTKVEVYTTCVLTCLLYASETWTLYKRHIDRLDRFHLNCLRRILNLKWQDMTPDTTVLERAKTSGIAVLLVKNQLRWAGHLVRLDEQRLPKQIFYGELSSGKRPQHNPKKRFKDCLKVNLKKLDISVDDWEALATDRAQWRKTISDGARNFESGRIKHAKLKRACRKQLPVTAPTMELLKCNVCGRQLLSKGGLAMHLKSHDDFIPLECQLCSKTCKTARGLRTHMKTHDHQRRGQGDEGTALV